MTYNPRVSNMKEKTRGAKVSSDDSSPGIPSVVGAVNFDVSGSQRKQTRLLERDLRLGRATWNKYVLPVSDKFGDMIYQELFKLYPSYEHFFMNKLEAPHQDIFHGNVMKKHMNHRLMSKLTEIMENLDNQQNLNDIMTKLGLYHVKLGVQRKQMENMQRVIVETVRIVMGNKMQHDEEEALNNCLHSAISISIAAGEEYLETIATKQAVSSAANPDIQKSTKALRPSVTK